MVIFHSDFNNRSSPVFKDIVCCDGLSQSAILEPPSRRKTKELANDVYDEGDTSERDSWEAFKRAERTPHNVYSAENFKLFESKKAESTGAERHSRLKIKILPQSGGTFILR